MEPPTISELRNEVEEARATAKLFEELRLLKSAKRRYNNSYLYDAFDEAKKDLKGGLSVFCKFISDVNKQIEPEPVRGWIETVEFETFETCDEEQPEPSQSLVEGVSDCFSSLDMSLAPAQLTI